MTIQELAQINAMKYLADKNPKQYMYQLGYVRGRYGELKEHHILLEKLQYVGFLIAHDIIVDTNVTFMNHFSSKESS